MAESSKARHDSKFKLMRQSRAFSCFGNLFFTWLDPVRELLRGQQVDVRRRLPLLQPWVGSLWNRNGVAYAEKFVLNVRETDLDDVAEEGEHLLVLGRLDPEGLLRAAGGDGHGDVVLHKKQDFYKGVATRRATH